MLARDIMTPDPITASPDTSVAVIAQRLLARGVSALPVLNAEHEVIGMVSEGDLIRGNGGLTPEAGGSSPRKDWWLALLAEGEPLSKAFIDNLSRGRTAAEVMSSPVVTVAGGTDLGEVARILSEYHIKRVPVVEGQKLVGIVSRADLLRAFLQANPTRPHPSGGFDGLLAQATASLSKYLPHEVDSPTLVPANGGTAPAALSVPAAASFRGLMNDYAQQKVLNRLEAKRRTLEARKVMVQDMIDTHVTDKMWAAMLHDAAEAASQGLKEHLLLRFPSDVCTDGGRAINQSEESWATTLQGEPAEVYLRWKAELEPRGFLLKARTLEYIDGFPGDIGLFLNWAPESFT
ncbi:CBS domain-containing protein [Asticcacaulis sp.]|uniref:CBS domain-containing protein n=1 Tax=Asticcacaulis sp. TaxID=1872648 RepID=UPI0031DCA8DE